MGKNRPLVSKSKLALGFNHLSPAKPLPFFLYVLCLVFPPFRANNKYFLHCTCIPRPMTVLAVTVMTPSNASRRRSNPLSTMTHLALCPAKRAHKLYHPTPQCHHRKRAPLINIDLETKCISFWIHSRYKSKPKKHDGPSERPFFKLVASRSLLCFFLRPCNGKSQL